MWVEVGKRRKVYCVPYGRCWSRGGDARLARTGGRLNNIRSERGAEAVKV